MLAYIIRRLLILPIIILGVTIFIFSMWSLLDPRERASLYVHDIPHGPDALQRVIERYGLNDPIPIQYFRWLGQIIRGNFGWSRTAQRPILKAIFYYLPATAELALWAIIPVIFIGILLGILSAIHHNGAIDHINRVFSIIGWSFPTFVFALLMLLLFYAKLGWFPAGRLSDWAVRATISSQYVHYTGMNTVDSLLNGRIDIFWDALRHLILPVITLAYVQWALLLRVTRSSMLETLRQDYITTARAKGLKERVVINKHATRNALIPVTTVGGLLIIGLLNGVVITETVFNYRGMGWWAANAALHLDIQSVLGFALFNGILLVLGNLMVDVLYTVIDPRVRLE